MRLSTRPTRLLIAFAVIGLALGESVEASPESSPANQGAPSDAPLSADQLQQLVAPIALYPDALVAQILAASTYPTQIVEAERFLQKNPNLKGAELGKEVDQQAWDPSVKALTQFPSVIADMDKNLSWTSELGDVNSNQQGELMNAVQAMRDKAEKSGNLKTTPEQRVSTQGSTVVIEPVNPEVVYVPVYNPEFVYGYPVGMWPGFYPWWGPGPYFSFGIGFGIGPFFGYGWGWHGWGVNWHGRYVMYGGGHYVFHGRSFYNRSAYFHGNPRGNYHAGAGGFRGGDRGLRGYGGANGRGNAGLHSGAFGGAATHGGVERMNSSRGRSSMGRPSVGRASMGHGGRR